MRWLIGIAALLVCSTAAAQEGQPPLPAEAEALIRQFETTLEDEAAEMEASLATIRDEVEAVLDKAGFALHEKYLIEEQLGSLVTRKLGSVSLAARLLTQEERLWIIHKQLGSLTLTTPEGFDADARFEVTGPGERIETDPRHYTLSWTGSAESLPLSIRLQRGSNFEIVETDCPETLPPEGSCTISVRFAADASGTFHDTLHAAAGRPKARLSLSGEASGWPRGYLVWADGQNPEIATVDGDAGERTAAVEVIAVNEGEGPVSLPEVRFVWGNRKGGAHWETDLASPCLTTATPAGERCTVRMIFRPRHDGQAPVHITLPVVRDRPIDTRLRLRGNARNIEGDLPDGVLATGDACPAPGSPASILVSATTHLTGGTQPATMHVATCESWFEQDGELRCDNPGQGRHTATLERFGAETLDGPWQRTEVRERNVTAALTCRDGLIEWVEWTW